MNQKYLVSILLPTYNSGKYLDDCLKSVVNQSYKNIELVIIDNNSTDNTQEIFKKYKNFLKINFFNHKTKNLAEALNFGINNCSGEYIARMDSDDFMRKHRISKQLKFLVKNKSYFFVGTNVLRFKGKYFFFNKPFDIFYDDEDLKLNLLFQSSFIHPTIMFNKKMIQKNNLFYKNSMSECEDYDLWIRMLTKTKFKNLSYFGLFYRVHENSASLKKRNKLDNYFSNLNFSLLRDFDIDMSQHDFELHKKISELKIYKTDDFDILNTFYINFLLKIKNNRKINKIFNENKIKYFLSKKYFRFCIRSTQTINFSFFKCIKSDIKIKIPFIYILMLLSMLKIKI